MSQYDWYYQMNNPAGVTVKKTEHCMGVCVVDICMTDDGMEYKYIIQNEVICLRWYAYRYEKHILYNIHYLQQNANVDMRKQSDMKLVGHRNTTMFIKAKMQQGFKFSY